MFAHVAMQESLRGHATFLATKFASVYQYNGMLSDPD